MTSYDICIYLHIHGLVIFGVIYWSCHVCMRRAWHDGVVAIIALGLWLPRITWSFRGRAWNEGLVAVFVLVGLMDIIIINHLVFLAPVIHWG